MDGVSGRFGTEESNRGIKGTRPITVVRRPIVPSNTVRAIAVTCVTAPVRRGPQCAIAHRGSVVATHSNASRACGYVM